MTKFNWCETLRNKSLFNMGDENKELLVIKSLLKKHCIAIILLCDSLVHFTLLVYFMCLI